MYTQLVLAQSPAYDIAHGCHSSGDLVRPLPFIFPTFALCLVYRVVTACHTLATATSDKKKMSLIYSIFNSTVVLGLYYLHFHYYFNTKSVTFINMSYTCVQPLMYANVFQ